MEISFTCRRPKTGDRSDFIHEMHVPVAVEQPTKYVSTENG
jgi:hypothetical protein